MYLRSLTVDGFKNLQTQTIEFPAQAGINILLGKNGQGKTNLLEAIRFLALPKPLRSRRLNDCVLLGGNHFRVAGEFAEARADQLEFGFQIKPSKRVHKENYGEVGIKQFIGKLHVVLFTPDDMNLLTGAPSLRRRFLDSLLTQLFPEYFEAMTHYYHALRQRNALLKQLNGKANLRDELAIWDRKLVEPMTIMINYRLEFLRYCETKLSGLYEELAASDEEIVLHYNWSLDLNEQITEEVLLDKLAVHRDEDIRYGYTGYGPHRHDFEVLINQQPAKVVASRGELRSIVLCFKLLELSYFAEVANSKPLLLLDDVFSELDSARRDQLLKKAQEHQTFITTVEAGYFAESELNPQIYAVEAGIIKADVL